MIHRQNLLYPASQSKTFTLRGTSFLNKLGWNLRISLARINIWQKDTHWICHENRAPKFLYHSQPLRWKPSQKDPLRTTSQQSSNLLAPYEIKDTKQHYSDEVHNSSSPWQLYLKQKRKGEGISKWRWSHQPIHHAKRRTPSQNTPCNWYSPQKP